MSAEEPEEHQAIWRALSNPVRRRLLDLLREGPMTTGDLTDRFPGLTRFSIMQHLGVLEEADLVVHRRAGRARYNHLNPVPIQRIVDRWLAPYVRPWTEALVGLQAELERMSDEDPGAEGTARGDVA